MTTFSFDLPAGGGEVFAPDSADSLAGSNTTIRDLDGTSHDARILDAKVVREGAAIQLTVRTEADIPGLSHLNDTNDLTFGES